MKCPYCGAPVTLTDEFCPYCGALNAPARKHIADMRSYNADYQNTRRAVLTNADRQSRSHSRIIVLILLVVLNVAVFVGQIGAYGIGEWWQSRQIHAHRAEYAAAMDKMESDGNYFMLAKYYTRNNLYDEKSLRHYSIVSEMAQNYVRMTESVYYLNSGVENYNSQGEQLQRAAQGVRYFYDNLKSQEKEYYSEYFTETHLKTMRDMETKMWAILKAECGLTDEDLATLPELESQSIMLLMGRRMGIYE